MTRLEATFHVLWDCGTLAELRLWAPFHEPKQLSQRAIQQNTAFQKEDVHYIIIGHGTKVSMAYHDYGPTGVYHVI